MSRNEKINLTIVDPAGVQTWQVSAPRDWTGERLIGEFVEKKNLPKVQGDSVTTYGGVVKRNNAELVPNKSIADLGLKDGDVIRLKKTLNAKSL
jgi:hypothetical protein